MQDKITIQNLRNAFWDWQCWWYVAKSTGDIEDIGALCVASERYERACKNFLAQHPNMTWDEREAYAFFREEYDRLTALEDSEAEDERE